MPTVPGGDPVPRSHSVSCRNSRGSDEVPTSTGLAGPSGPARGVIIRRAMLLLQTAHSGFHRAGGPLIRTSDQGD